MEKSFVLKLLFFSTVILFLLFVHTHGFIPYDEGWFIQAAHRMINGQVPYRDFQFTYNPGALYLNLIAFKLFGLSVLSTRLMAMGLSLLASWLLWKLGEKLKLNYWLRMLVILGYISWGPGHINFIWPVMICVTLGIGVALTTLPTESKNLQKHRAFISGLLTAGIFVAKQNFGLAILLPIFLNFLFNKRFNDRRTFLFFLLGYLTVIVTQIIYFLGTGSLVSYLSEFYQLTIIKIVREGVLASPYPWQYESTLFYRFGKTFFYLFPLLFAVACFVFLWKRDRKLLILPLMVASYYLLSIRPTTDYVHLTPLLALTAPLTFYFYKFITNRIGKAFLVFGLILFVLSGFYSSLFKRYYRWNTPLLNENVLINHPRVQVWADEPAREIVSSINQYFVNKNDKKLFVYSFTPMFYFILDKQNPTRYDYLHPGFLTKSVDSEIVTRLNKENLSHVITDVNIEYDPSNIAWFIKTNFTRDFAVGGFTIWKKNLTNASDTPAPKLAFDSPPK